jgi:hypothetical protein
VDTKNVGLYGRSWTKLNILDGLPRISIHDPFDVLVDRYASRGTSIAPGESPTSAFTMPCSDIEVNPLYDKAAVRRKAIDCPLRSSLTSPAAAS